MGFGKVNKSVLTDPQISPGAKGLYSLLCCYKNSDNICNPGINRLSDELNVSHTTIKRWIKELTDHKVIMRCQKDQRSSSVTTILR